MGLADRLRIGCRKVPFYTIVDTGKSGIGELCVAIFNACRNRLWCRIVSAKAFLQADIGGKTCADSVYVASCGIDADDPANVAAAITGKTFQYTRNDGNGFVTYNADGTFSFQDDAKGGGVGKWTANGTQYCESWGKGMPECGVFKNTGDAFFAANSRLVEMKT